jgi:competence protein ComGC
LSEVYSEGYPPMNIEGERLAFLDIVQNVFTDGGPGGGHLIPQKWSWWMDNENDFEMWKDFGLLMPLSTAASIIHARRDETVSKANEFYNRCAENAKITPYEKHIGKVGSTEKILFSLSEYRYFLLRFFMPALDRVSEIVYRGKTSHEATVTILALKRYRQEKNEYPANLNELVTAGYLKELPMDPFSDKPLMYKKTDDDFTLYSLSYNFTDDSGEPGKDREGRVRKWGDNGDAVFWPVQK